MIAPKKGDVLIWTGASDRIDVDVEVTRVSTQGLWVDVLVFDARGPWAVRHALPLPDTFRPIGVEL